METTFIRIGNEPGDIWPETLSEERRIGFKETDPEFEDRLRIIWQCLPSLSERERQAVTLCGMKGHSLELAAAIMGVSKGTAQTLIKRARKKILKRWEELKDE